MCPSAMRDPNKGAAYAAMVQGCLSPILNASKSKLRTFIRCDINFEVLRRSSSFNNLVGRAAHIELLESQAYIRFLFWHYNDCFVDVKS